MPRKRKEEDLNGELMMEVGKLNKPHQRFAANARERSRMRVLSKAFSRLKTTLPWVPPDTILSKLDTLRLASSYIAHLQQILDHEDTIQTHGSFIHPLNLTWPFTFSNRTFGSVVSSCHQTGKGNDDGSNGTKDNQNKNSNKQSCNTINNNDNSICKSRSNNNSNSTTTTSNINNSLDDYHPSMHETKNYPHALNGQQTHHNNLTAAANSIVKEHSQILESFCNGGGISPVSDLSSCSENDLHHHNL